MYAWLAVQGLIPRLLWMRDAYIIAILPTKTTSDGYITTTELRRADTGEPVHAIRNRVRFIGGEA